MYRTIFAAAFLLPAPLAAQDFSGSYEIIGTAELQVDGAAVTLHSLHDRDRDRSYNDLTESGGFTVYAFTAAAPQEDGSAGRPYLTLMIGPFGSAPGGEVDVEYRAADGTDYFANRDSGTTGTLSDLVIADGRISFGFEAPSLIALETTADWDYVPVEGVAPIAVSGRYSGQLPTE